MERLEFSTIISLSRAFYLAAGACDVEKQQTIVDTLGFVISNHLYFLTCLQDLYSQHVIDKYVSLAERIVPCQQLTVK